MILPSISLPWAAGYASSILKIIADELDRDIDTPTFAPDRLRLIAEVLNTARVAR